MGFNKTMKWLDWYEVSVGCAGCGGEETDRVPIRTVVDIGIRKPYNMGNGNEITEKTS